MVFRCAYDIETHGTSDRLICASLVYNTRRGIKKEETFKDKKRLKERIIELGYKALKEGTRMEIYAHNSIFEFSRVFGFDIEDQYIPNKQDGINIVCLGKVFGADYRTKEGKEIIAFYDSWNLMNRPLKECGKVIGLNKIDLENEYPKIFEKLCNEKLNKSDFTFEELAILQEYNIRDAWVSLEIVNYIKGMLAKEGYKPQRMVTAPQIAINLFNNYIRKNKLQKYLMKWKDDPTELRRGGYEYIMTKYPEEIHEGYRAGRLDIIQTGEFENVTNLDINSAYSLAETQLEFPDLRTEQRIENPLETLDIKTIVNSYGITKCIIENPKQEIGYLPIRYKKEIIDETIFPTHECIMVGTWTNLELEKAIRLGYKIKDIEYTINYAIAEENPLKQFAEDIYEKRMKDKFGKAFYKLIANSVHGKLSQRMTIKEYMVEDIGETPRLEKEGWEQYSDIDDFNILFSKTIETKYGRNYAPIISSYVTAKCRDILYEEAKKIPAKDLLYFATDAILFKGNHYDKFKIGNGLGEMKIVEKFGEKLQNTNAKLYGKNNYFVGEDVRISGVKKKYLENYDGKGIIKYERFKNITNSKSLKDSFRMEKLEKNLNEIKEKTDKFKEFIKKQEYMIDTKTKKEWITAKI